MNQYNNQSGHSCKNCSSIKSGIFCHVDSKRLEILDNNKRMLTYTKGELVFKQGHIPQGLFIVQEGNLKITRIGDNGKTSILRIVPAGEVAGQRSLFAKKFYGASAVAISGTTICFYEKDFILDFMRSNPDVSIHLLEKTSEYLGQSDNKLISLHQRNVRERLAEFLLNIKENHSTEVEKGIFRIDLSLTREEMANIIGTAVETLIRFLSEFKENKLVKQEGRTLFITNAKELESWANLPS